MSSSNLIRFGGLATMLAGALVVISSIAPVMGVIDLANFPEVATTGTYAWLTRLLVLANMLLLGGLVALYADRWEAVDGMGLVGFVVAFVGTAMALGYVWAEAFVVPAVAEIAAGRLDSIYNIGPWVGARFLSRVIFCVGWVFFGLAAFAARVYPSSAAGVLMAGALINLVPHPVAGLVFAVGLVVVGFVHFTRRGASDQQPSRVR